MTLSSLAAQVQLHDRDRFYTALFVPSSAREALFALYALNAELLQVRQRVNEEMIGHLRYAWWQEAVEGLYAGHVAHGQPVLEALLPLVAQLPRDRMLALVDSYRAAFPDPPVGVDNILEALSLDVLRAFAVDAAGWRKANAVIAEHRAHFGTRWNAWLMVKLLVAGL